MAELSVLSDLRELIKFVYQIRFREDEKFGLQSQIRRAAVSVALNIREGNVFEGKNKKKFFMQALGSLQEVDECMEICKNLRILSFLPSDLTTMDFIERLGEDYDNSKNSFEHYFDYYRKIYYWLVLNKLKKLIQSIHSGGPDGTS